MISVIITHYQHRAYLPDAIKSILAQQYGDLEIIIVNDDPGAELRQYQLVDDRIQVINTGSNIGQTGALNLGITHATGDYVAFQDADDISQPYRLGVSLKVAEINDADLVYGAKILKSKDGLSYWEPPEWTKENILGKGLGCWGSILVRRHFLEKCLFDEDAGYHNDHIWMARTLACGVKAVRISVALYTQRADTSTYAVRTNKIPVVRKFKRLALQRKVANQVRQIIEGGA